MSRLKQYLNRPVPYSDKPWQVVLAAASVVFLILSLSVNIGAESPVSRWFIVSGFTLITAAATAFTGYLLPALFVKFYRKDKWVLWKGLLNNLLILFIISSLNALFYYLALDQSVSFTKVFTSFVFVTLIVGLLPMTFVAFVVQNSALKRNLAEAMALNAALSTRPGREHETKNTESRRKIRLAGTTREYVEIMAGDIYYIESRGNYADICYGSDKITRKAIRATISAMEAELQSEPGIVRCHRAFIVNTTRVINVSGNAQGLSLSLNGIDREIPVSRSYVKIFRNALHNL